MSHRRLIGVGTAVVALLLPAAAHADTDITPEKQLVGTYTGTLSFFGPKSAAAPIVSSLLTALDRYHEIGAGRHPEEEEGDTRIPLTKSHPSHTYPNPTFTHYTQWTYPSAVSWGMKLTQSGQDVARGPVQEQTYWYVNSGARASSGAPHEEAPDYLFHGSITGLAVGDTVDLVTEFDFPCQISSEEDSCTVMFYGEYYLSSG